MIHVVFNRIALFFCLAGLTGCAVPGALLYKFSGPPAVPARYSPVNEPMLVMVEPAQATGGSIPEADDLAESLTIDFRRENIAPMIEPRSVNELRDKNPLTYHKMSISQIGQAVGAKQVLYVSIKRMEFDHPVGGDVVRGKIATSFKVIDTQSAASRWPTGADGEPFEYETPYKRISPEITETALRMEILREISVVIGRNFYKWQPDTMKEENQDVRLR